MSVPCSDGEAFGTREDMLMVSSSLLELLFRSLDSLYAIGGSSMMDDESSVTDRRDAIDDTGDGASFNEEYTECLLKMAVVYVGDAALAGLAM